MSEEKGEFSVYWWDPSGTYYEEARFVPVEAAMEKVKSLLLRKPARAMRLFQKIMITDGGDCCVFEWKIDEGVVFPPDLKGQWKWYPV